jgi:SWI/SNF-related matrix-associated actin-dependent regulator of chromatin subfamily A-like protein 1
MLSDAEIKLSVPKDLELRNFQYGGVRFLEERSRALLASDPGCGKTVMAIVAANVVALPYKRSFKVLVLCPKSVLINWQREIEKWNMNPAIDWYVHNWDRLINRKYENLNKEKWDIVIGDESHKCIKSMKSKRAQIFMNGVVPNARHVWLMTATPASVSGLDYLGTLQVLLPKEFLKWDEWKFKKMFCEAIPDRWVHGGFRYEGFKNTALLRDIFKKCALRHKKAEVLPDLPAKIYTHLEVDIDKKIAAQHLEIDVEAVVKLMEEGRPLPGHLAVVMQATALAKVKHLLDLVEDMAGNYVVFAWHRNVVHAVATKIPGAVTITGETSLANRQNYVDKFQSGELKVIVANMSAGGVGITLTKAHTAIYIEYPHSPADLLQSEDRIHRIGSDHASVNIIRLVGKGTIDLPIFEKLDMRMRKMNEVGV